jgi:hypothetical protein
MLDIDASFAPAPEFQTTRRLVAERALLSHDRLEGVGILTSPVIPAIAVPECAKATPPVKRFAARDETPRKGAAEIAQETGYAALFAAVPAESLPEPSFFLASAADEDLAEEAPALTALADPATAPHPEPVMAEARPVTPRRPLRFTSARETGDAAPVTLPTLNLFSDVFHDDILDQPDLDPRLRRSRERAMSRLAAYESALPSEQRNLWHDDAATAPAETHAEARSEASAEMSPPAPVVQAQTESTPMPAAALPRRPVRHIEVKRRAADRSAATVAFHDPLQDHLHRVRDALYTVDPEDEPAPQPEPALHLRLLALLMHVALLLATLPDRLASALAQFTPSLRRGYSLRLATAASLAAAAVMVLRQVDPSRLL